MTVQSFDTGAPAFAPRFPSATWLPIVAMVIGFGAGYAAHQPAQLGAIRDSVAQVIRDNPDLITDALRASQATSERVRLDAATASIPNHELDLLHDPLSPVAGNPAGDVTIVEFFDYRCPFCKKTASALDALLASDPDIRVVYKEYPVLGPDSTYATRLALAAGGQGKYDQLHAALFAAPSGADGHGYRAGFDGATVSLGLDPAALEEAGHSADIDVEIQRNAALAKAIGIRGTPAWVIGNHFVEGAQTTEQLAAAVAEARAAARAR